MDDEIVYFLRILLLIFKGGMLVCKGVLNKELKDGNVSLDQILKEKKERLRHKILRIQHHMLFRNDSVNPDDFDLSLLIVVLLDVMNLSSNESKHVATIKETRDKIIHGGKVALDKNTYDSMEKSLKTSLSMLAENLSKDIQIELTQMIKTFLTEPFGRRTALRYVDGIKNEEEILQWVHGKVEELVWEITTPECQMIEDMKHHQEIVLDKLIQIMKEFNDEKSNLNGPKKIVSTSDAFCMKCLGDHIPNDAEVYCVTCRSYLCADCNILLHVTSLKISMKNHHIRNAKAAAETVDMKGMDICNKHSELFVFYCKSHDELCCDECKNHDHRTCEQLTEIEKLAHHSYNSELNPVAEIGQLQRKIESMEEWLTSLETKITKQFEKLPSKLQDKRTKMLEAFDEKAEMLKRNAEIIYKEKMDTISRNRSQFEQLDRKSDQAKISLKLIEATGTAADRFIARHYLNKRFKTFVEYYDNIKEIYESANELEDFTSVDSIKDDIESLSINIPKDKDS